LEQFYSSPKNCRAEHRKNPSNGGFFVLVKSACNRDEGVAAPKSIAFPGLTAFPKDLSCLPSPSQP
jgi:hypothetical protein